MARNCCRYFTVSLVPAAALILAVLFACGIILLPILYVDVVKDYVYGVVIDAGSSHTTLYIYRWRVPSAWFTQSSTGKAEGIFTCNSSNSVNSYTSDPTRVSEAFQHCLSSSYEPRFNEPVVPVDQRRYTNLYLGATAGMRLVREQNKNLSDEILHNIAVALQSPNISQYNYSDSAILTGSQEARAGWVSANYLNNSCSAFRTPNDTIGALDLGGASTQISFESNATFNQEYKKTETVFGVQYHLYARSLLCFGENEAHSRYWAYLINQSKSTSSSKTNEISDPCLFKGASVTVSSSNIFTTCANSSTAVRVFGHQLTPPPSLSSAPSHTFTGAGNSYECQEKVKAALGSFCFMNNCSNFKSPPVAGRFVGFSGFFYNADFFNFTNTTFTSRTGWGALVSKVDTFCNLTNAQAVASFGGDKYLYNRCFIGQFVTHLLKSGFGFKKGTHTPWTVDFINIMKDPDTSQTTLSWALGYILDRSSYIPQSPFYETHPYTVVDLVVGMVILLVLCVIFITFFFLTFYACRKALNTRSGYQNI